MRAHTPSAREIADLFEVADRDLAACETPDLHIDWKFTIAYNAALRLAGAALAAAGFEAERAAHHYRVIQSLELTIGWPPEDIQLLDTFRKKRNTSGYVMTDTVSSEEAEEIRRLARRLRSDVRAWLVARHPRLAAGLSR